MRSYTLIIFGLLVSSSYFLAQIHLLNQELSSSKKEVADLKDALETLEVQVNDMLKRSLSLWDVKKNPEKYLGERDVLLALVDVTNLTTPAPSGFIYVAQIRDSYGYEVAFYIPFGLIDTYRSCIGKDVMFHMNGSINPNPLHGIAPEEPAFNVLVNEKRSDGMWNTITIELIKP